MRTRSAIATGLALALAASVAASAGEQQRDAKAADVVASARKAIGAKKLDDLKALSVDASVERNIGNMQVKSDVELLVELPDKYMRAETPNGPMAAMTSTLGFNGDRPLKATAAAGFAPGGGMIIRMGGPGPGPMPPPEKPTPEQQQTLEKAAVRASKQEVSRLLLGWTAMALPSLGAEYTYAGEAESPDGKAFAVDVKAADGFAARLFVDQETKLPLMISYQGRQGRVVTSFNRGGGPGREGGDATPQVRGLEREPQATVEFVLYFDDWRDVDGIKFPYRMRRSTGGNTVEEWTVGKVRVNPKIDPKKFEAAG
jgi:hypothetical protein